MPTFERRLRELRPAELFPLAVGVQAYYGNDDNVDPAQESLSEKKRMNVAATAAVIDIARFEDKGDGRFVLKPAKTLGELGACCDQHRRDDISVATCTAFLISPNVVATARHCVKTNSIADSVRFVFGFAKDKDGKLPPVFIAKQTIFKAYRVRRSCTDNRNIDWAIVELDGVVRGVSPVQIGDGQPLVGDRIYMVSSPLGVPLKLAANASVRRNSDLGFFVSDIDGFTDGSGGPVFAEANDNVEGVYLRGEVDVRKVCGCMRASICPQNACRGEDATRIGRLPRAIDDPPTDCEEPASLVASR